MKTPLTLIITLLVSAAFAAATLVSSDTFNGPGTDLNNRAPIRGGKTLNVYPAFEQDASCMTNRGGADKGASPDLGTNFFDNSITGYDASAFKTFFIGIETDTGGSAMQIDSVSPQAVPPPKELMITPRPSSISIHVGSFILTKGTSVFPGSLGQSGVDATQELSKAAGFQLGTAVSEGAGYVTFLGPESIPDTLEVDEPTGEGYVLWIRPEGVVVFAGARAGHYYALQSLIQLLESAEKSGDNLKLPCALIIDHPRFAWRGYMLDVSRHFTKVEDLKKTLDAMARYKLNRFHWHLTDSAGWRIEIKQYPKLASVGGRGNESNVSLDARAEYYTQDEIREIVAYAKARNITVIPEIDMPGHADAAVKAYPEHDGGGYLKQGESKKWPNFTFNPAKPETLEFLKNILSEVSELFPESPIIHFGGDEVHFGWDKWPTLPDVEALMRRENYTKLSQVEQWFNRQIIDHINSLDKVAGGWDEIADDSHSTDDILVFWWRHDKPGVLEQALNGGYQVVLCPRQPLYFDFVQDDSHAIGRRWDGPVYIENTYAFPDTLGIGSEQWQYVHGLQANLWTETAVTQDRRDFLTWPRLIAVAESAWTLPARKDFQSFNQRLPRQIDWLRSRGIEAWDPFKKTPEIKR